MIKVNGNIIEQNHFSSGELKLHFNNYFSIVDKICCRIDWHYENDAELFTLICVKKHIHKDCMCYLHMPYIPHARMDRVKSANDVFTLKYFCEIINSLNFAEVIVDDAHSNVALALLDRVRHNEPVAAIDNALDQADNGNLALFFPDAGAQKRYSDLPGVGFYPNTFGIKKRNWENQKIESLVIADPEIVNGKEVLIIDDICSYGNTFVRAAQALKEAGATRVSLYITHCENAIVKGDVFKHIDRVFTTDSLVHTDEVKEKIIYVG